MMLMMLACASYDFDPPEHPRHYRSESEASLDGGAPLMKSGFHAALMDTPYLCMDPITEQQTACPDERPADAHLSCDASGCHGDFDYSPGADRSARHLRGSDGPSCYSCHEKEWSSRQE